MYDSIDGATAYSRRAVRFASGRNERDVQYDKDFFFLPTENRKCKGKSADAAVHSVQDGRLCTQSTIDGSCNESDRGCGR
jgi:hypothetical protein